MNLCAFFVAAAAAIFWLVCLNIKVASKILSNILSVYISMVMFIATRICNVFILVRGTDFRVRFLSYSGFRFFFSYQNLFTRIKQNSKQ